MIQLYILFMITPLFFSLAQVDRSAIEAARDLGGNWWRTFREVILPQTMPGIVIGSIFIFVLTMGDYGTVHAIGGGNITSVGTLINSKIGAPSIPQGAASAVLLVIVLMVGVWVITRFVEPAGGAVIERSHPPMERHAGRRRPAQGQAAPRLGEVGPRRLLRPLPGLPVHPDDPDGDPLLPGLDRAAARSPSAARSSLDWWRTLFGPSNVFNTISDDVSASGASRSGSASPRARSSRCSGFSLSMAFRRRWRFRTDAIAFYIIMLALMTPAFLVGLGNQLLWKFMGQTPNLWHTALGANVIWGIPFSFLVMLAVWNRYDRHIEEAARDLGANAATTFREVTLPLVWTGHLRQLPVRLHADLERLRPHDPARRTATKPSRCRS